MLRIITLLVVVGAAIVLALALAYIPMRVLLGQIARSVKQFIDRQRERRRRRRETPDRRKPA